MWLALSATANNPTVVKNRDIISKRLTQQQIGHAQQLARDCQQGHFIGCN